MSGTETGNRHQRSDEDVSDDDSINEELAVLQASSQEREGLEGQIVFKGDYESGSDDE